MNIVKEKWLDIIEKVKNDYFLTEVSYTTWLLPLQVYEVTEDTVTVLIPSDKEHAINIISKKYKMLLEVVIEEVTGQRYEVSFILEKDIDRKRTEKAVHTPVSNESIEKAGLNPRYTFDTFVVGKNNTFAHAASLAVAETPGELYNPLFLYGGVGLGKTHLMHSIAHYILETNPNTRVLYVTSEVFTNELIESIRNGNNTAMTKFREKYRNIDVLLIDDVQFIIGKESTQEEFFHTFNHLHGLKKQIVISSDRPPKDMETLEARLSSRFEWGLVADISSPDYETRMAILRKKEELDGYDIDDEVIQYIATNIKSNIRELEGALNKLIAMSNLQHKEISLDMAKDALQDMISPDARREITPEIIIQTVAEHFGVSYSDIIGQKRTSNIMFPRQISMYLCQELTDSTLMSIGKVMGNRDHSTIINGIKKIQKEIQNSETTKNTIDAIRKKLNPA